MTSRAATACSVSCARGSSGSRALRRRVFRSSVCSAGVLDGDDRGRRHAPTADADRESALDRVGPGYFATLGVPLRSGRDISDERSCRRPEGLRRQRSLRAERYFGGRNPIGLRVTTIDDDDVRTTYQVVGVAAMRASQKLARRHRAAVLRAGRAAAVVGDQPHVPDSHGAAPAVDARPCAKRRKAWMPRCAVTSVESLEEQMAPLTAQDRDHRAARRRIRDRRAQARRHRPLRRAVLRHRPAIRRNRAPHRPGRAIRAASSR